MNKEPSKKLLELLLKIALGICYGTAKYRMRKFKKDFPEAWERFENLKKKMKIHRYTLRWRRIDNQQMCIKTFTDLSLEYERPIIEILEDSDRIKGFF